MNIDANSTPIDVFESLFTEEILELIVKCSNDYGAVLSSLDRPKTKYSRSATFRTVPKDEMTRFFGLCLLQEPVSTCVNSFRTNTYFFSIRYFHPVFRFLCVCKNIWADTYSFVLFNTKIGRKRWNWDTFEFAYISCYISEAGLPLEFILKTVECVNVLWNHQWRWRC